MKFLFTLDDVFHEHLLKQTYKDLLKEGLPEDVVQIFLFIVAKHVLLSYTDRTIQGDGFIVHPIVKLGPMLAELSMIFNARFDSHIESIPFRMHAYNLANSKTVRTNRIREILHFGNKLYRPSKVEIINPAIGTAYFSVE